MGGKAFGFISKRMDVDEYNEVCDTIDIQIFCSNMIFGYIPNSYINKDSFGDVDILVDRSRFSFSDFYRIYHNEYKDFKWNDGIYSLLDLEDRQIDIITTTPELVQCHYDYLSYNDLGNFVGKLAHKLGLKYGMDGLSVLVRAPENASIKLGTINIAKDKNYIYELLDVNLPDEINSMEDIFKAITNSKYFHKEFFDLDKLNHKSRNRDKKRINYVKLLSYINDNNIQNKSDSAKKLRLDETLAILDRPEINEECKKLFQEHLDRRRFKAEVNGDIVGAITGLKGKELGKFIKHCSNNVDIDAGDINLQIHKLFIKY